LIDLVILVVLDISYNLNAMCNISAQGLTGLIGYSYKQVTTSFPEAHLQRTLRLSMLGLEQFQDG
jgi:hypothetical protein